MVRHGNLWIFCGAAGRDNAAVVRLWGKGTSDCEYGDRMRIHPAVRELEEFYRKYHDKGLEILDIPCNQFAGQTPGDRWGDPRVLHAEISHRVPSDEEIRRQRRTSASAVCVLKIPEGICGFGKGAKAAAMGIMLRKIDKNYKENPDIKWNFTKFLVDRQGTVVVRFEPTGDMNELERQILALL